MKRKIMALLLSVTATIGMLAGCGDSTSSASASTAAGSTATATGEKVELRFSWWGSDNRHEAMQKVIDRYMEQNPNVTITPEYAAFDGYQQKLFTQLTGKTETDIMQVNYNWVHSFGNGKNVFLDLNEYADILQLDNWDSEYLEAMTVDGQLGALPHGMTARVNLYNKTLMADNNIEFPLTYDEINTSGNVIGANNTEMGAENQYVMTNIGKQSTDLFIAQMLYDKTGKVMQVDGKVSYTAEEVAEVLETYKSFEDSNAMPTFKQEDPIQNESNPVWTNGRSGSVYEWVGTVDKYLASYKNGDAKDEIGVAPYFELTAGTKPNVYIKPSLGFAISRNSKNPEEAAKFLNFLFTDEEAVKLMGTNLGISCNTVTLGYQDAAGMLTGAMKEGYEMLAEYDQTVLDPYFEDENVRKARYNAIEAYRTGSMTAEQAAKDYVEKQQTELDKVLK